MIDRLLIVSADIPTPCSSRLSQDLSYLKLLIWNYLEFQNRISLVYKAKEKILRENENEDETSGLNEEQKIDKNNNAIEKRLREKENENKTSGLNEEQKNDKNNKAKEKRLREKGNETANKTFDSRSKN